MGKSRQEGWRRHLYGKMNNNHSGISLYHLISIIICLNKCFFMCGPKIILFDFIKEEELEIEGRKHFTALYNIYNYVPYATYHYH